MSGLLTQTSAWRPPQLMARDPACTWLSDVIRPWSPGTESDAVIVGVPLDYAVNYRPGARFGPNAIRASLSSLTTYVLDRRLDMSGLLVTDAGDVAVVQDLAETHDRIRRALSGMDREAVVIMLGGDHSISRPAIEAAGSRVGGRLGLIVLDTHLDVRPPVRGREHSGHWLGQLLSDAEGPVRSGNVGLIGLSAGNYCADYHQSLQDQGVLCYTVSDIRREGIGSVISRCLAAARENTEGVYVTVDIDVIHQAFAPGTSVPNPNGLWPDAVLDVVFEAAGTGVLSGLDVTEVNPMVDLTGVTSAVAGQIVIHALAGLVRSRQP